MINKCKHGLKESYIYQSAKNGQQKQPTKETLPQVFSYEFCEISKNTFSTKHLLATASAPMLQTFTRHLLKNEQLIYCLEAIEPLNKSDVKVNITSILKNYINIITFGFAKLLHISKYFAFHPIPLVCLIFQLH